MLNKRRLIKLTQRLIRIDSQNPPGDESAIAGFVYDYLKDIGIETKIYEFKKKRANVVATLKGAKSRNSLLVTPHLDTVPKGGSWHFNPFSAKVVRARIYGLGATDCKGNLASGLEVINSLFEDGFVLNYDLIFAATADEESGSGWGLIPLLEKKILAPTAAVVLDSDDFQIIVMQKGLVHFKVRLEGKRAHGAYPWRGKNAIDTAVDILKELKSYKFVYSKNKYLRPPTLNIGTIRGGDKVNIVADWCEFELDIRFLPDSSPGDLLREIRRIIQKYTKKFKIEIEGIQNPYYLDEAHSLVVSLREAMQKIKIRPEIRGSEGATAISFFQARHIPAVATGFGCSGCAHIADEYVKIDNLYKGAQVLEEFLKGYKF